MKDKPKNGHYYTEEDWEWSDELDTIAIGILYPLLFVAVVIGLTVLITLPILMLI